jgi:hypothetical protein
VIVVAVVFVVNGFTGIMKLFYLLDNFVRLLFQTKTLFFQTIALLDHLLSELFFAAFEGLLLVNVFHMRTS